jgi:hypothetical protein
MARFLLSQDIFRLFGNSSSCTNPALSSASVLQAEKEREGCDMTDSFVVDKRASGFASFHATKADVLAMRVIGRPRGDGHLIDIITYSEGEFTLRFAPSLTYSWV